MDPGQLLVAEKLDLSELRGARPVPVLSERVPNECPHPPKNTQKQLFWPAPGWCTRDMPPDHRYAVSIHEFLVGLPLKTRCYKRENFSQTCVPAERDHDFWL